MRDSDHLQPAGCGRQQTSLPTHPPRAPFARCRAKGLTLEADGLGLTLVLPVSHWQVGVVPVPISYGVEHYTG